MKCIARKKLDRSMNSRSEAERDIISSRRFREKKSDGSSITEANISLRAATTEGAASASRMNEAANETDTIPAIRINLTFIYPLSSGPVQMQIITVE
jgi:hypothetical protein